MSGAEHKRDVARRLRIAIEALGIQQKDIAAAMGVSPQRLNNWLTGQFYPDAHFVARFCGRYGVTTDYLYRGVIAGMAGDLAASVWAAEESSAE